MPADPGYGYQPNDGYNGGDPEDPNKGFGFDDQSIRRGFIRKVYSILMVSYFEMMTNLRDVTRNLIKILLLIWKCKNEINFNRSSLGIVDYK